MAKEKVKVIKEGGGNAVYCLGLFGAFIYQMQQAHSFWDVLVGIFQAIVWPAFLVYDALKALAA